MKKFFQFTSILFLFIGLIGCKTDVKLKTDVGTIHGVVQFENISNHEGINVVLESTDGLMATSYYSSRGIKSNVRSVESSVKTDENGSFHFDNVPVGVYTVTAFSDLSNKKAILTNVVVEKSEITELQEIKLKATGNLKGSVTIDNTKENVCGIDILVLGTSYSAVTDEEGKYEISDIPVKEGGYSLALRKDGYIFIFKRNITVNPGESIDIKNIDVKSSELNSNSLIWKGFSTEEPENPKLNWAYFNTTDRCLYVFNGESWVLLVQDGKDGDGNIHIFGEWQVIREPNEFVDGLKKHQCLTCKAIFEEVIPKLPIELKNPEPNATRKDNLDYIFNNQTLGTTTITMKRSEWNKLCENYRFFYKNENYVHAEKYEYEKDGTTWEIPNVGFRQRGNTSRFCPQGVDNGREQGQANADWSADYYTYAEQENDDYRQVHFKVDFEEFLEGDEELKMAGCMKGVALKRMDHSWGREIFCYDLFHKYGIWTAPRASHTRVILKFIEDETDNSITTVDYGVYEMFEEVNKQSLKARAQDEGETASNLWANNKGNLWKCSNDLTTGRMHDTGVEDIVIIFDENGNRVDWKWEGYSLDLKTNKDEFDSAKAELHGFIMDLNNLPTDTSDESIATIKAFYEEWFDMDFFLKTYAINILLGMDDDYWGNGNNYYLYFDTGKKGTGKLYFIPFDYDNTLGCSIHEGGFLQNPLEWGRGENRPLMDRMLLVPEFKQKFIELLYEVSAEDSYWNFERCSQQFLDWKAMLEPYAASPDLHDKISQKYWGDYTWQPGGYSLTSYSNNIFDATRYAIRGEENPNILKISEVECFDGIQISASYLPEGTHVRRVYLNDAVISDYITQETEFYYPYVTSGETYSVSVEYLNDSWETIVKTPEVRIEAMGGVGDITQNDISWSFEDNKLIFSSMPTISTSMNTDIDYEVFLELQTLNWESWIGEVEISSNTVDFTDERIIPEKFHNSDIIFKCFARFTNDLGDIEYRHIFFDFDNSNPIRITN